MQLKSDFSFNCMANSTIITGQFVRISQVPASLGERILARFIDYIILTVYLFSVFAIMGALRLYNFDGFAILFFVIFFYGPAFFYSLLFEVFNNGQSIGKKLLNIRVVKADGSTPSLSSYLMRWLLYLIDVTLTGGLGVVMILVTKNNQRLGDLAAGTMVIKEKNYKKIHVSLDEFDYAMDNYRPTYPQAADLSLEQVEIINKTLQSHNAERYTHIQQLAWKVAQVISVPPPPGGDERFLATLIRDYQYYALEII